MRQVIIMSGVSGSGKSTYGNEFLVSLKEGYRVIISADNFFMKEGVYRFDPSQLSLAHGKCFRKFIECVQDDFSLIIVDNTNTTSDEIAPYMLGAQAYGYEAEIRTLMCMSDEALMACKARNNHGVTSGGVFSQHRRLCEREIRPWWKHTILPVKE